MGIPRVQSPMMTLFLALCLQQDTFDFDLYERVRNERKGENVFLSPASVYFALAMAYNGSGGTTREAMAKVLRAEGLTLEDLNKSIANLLKSLSDIDPKVQLAIANSLWIRKDQKFQEGFAKRLKETFRAEAATMDSAATINDWVKKNTGGKIEKIIDDIDPEVLAYLINAVYFKGAWTVEFDKKETRDLPFTKLDGSKAQKPMMHRKGDLEVLQTKSFDAVRLPYGKNGRMKLYVFVPKDFENFRLEWKDEFRKREAEVTLPRFKLEFEIELKKVLSEMGMGVAFSDSADFRAMFVDQEAKISRVIHKTYVDVNEEGTEAAAVTAIEMKPTSAVQDPIHIKADRPFVVVLRDDTTKTNLFIGAIVNP